MIGNVTHQVEPPLPNKNSEIYILDIRNYTWVNTFLTTGSNSSGSNDRLKTIRIVIGVVSSISCIAILITIGYFSYKHNKEHRLRERTNEFAGVFGNFFY